MFLFTVQFKLVGPNRSNDLMVPNRLPGLSWPYRHAPKGPVADKVLAVNGCPTAYVNVTWAVARVNTWLLVVAVYFGTGKSRLRTAVVALSTKVAVSLYSIRTTRSVNRVNRALPTVTTACALATGL